MAQAPIDVMYGGQMSANEPINTEDLIEGQIPIVREVIANTSPNHPDYFIFKRELAGRLGLKFARHSVPPMPMADLFEAIDLAKEFINSLPTNHPDRTIWSQKFHSLLGDRFLAATDVEEEIDKATYAPDCGPGELGPELPPMRQPPVGSGPQNLPYDEDGDLNFEDLISGTVDHNGRWSFQPIRRGRFTGGARRAHVGSYEYGQGDFLYEEDGMGFLIGADEADLHTGHLGVNKWVQLPDELPYFLEDLVDTSTPSELCERCSDINVDMTLSELDGWNDECRLCRILCGCPIQENPDLKLIDAGAYIRVCSVYDPTGTTRTRPSDGYYDPRSASSNLHIGLPTYLNSSTKQQCALIKHWLRLCDSGKCGHDSGCAPKPMTTSNDKPARFIHVGWDQDSMRTDGIVHLVSTATLNETADYIALSHCWGSLSNGPPPWCTTISNITERMTKGIRVASLPVNFSDAIRVTRLLGKQYLWIDSLCILQGDKVDWMNEGKKMASVFKNAYCTIAATSAQNSQKGFLKRSREVPLYALVPSSSHGAVFVSTAIDDFEKDVGRGVLNSRAWVLQERVLARRTIHFTKRQMYFECGGGIQCETLTYMQNQGDASLFYDPEFPSSLKDRSPVARFKLFSSFFERYSRLQITQPTDRPIAINALAQELSKALDTTVHHGVFDAFLHRSLLWRRSEEPLRRIAFGDGQKIPSWSWMTYSGAINYADIHQQFEWDQNVQLNPPGYLEARLVTLRLELPGYQTQARNGIVKIQETEEKDFAGQIWHDGPGTDRAPPAQNAVIIGRQMEPDGVNLKGRRQYLVLCVDKLSGEHYARIGMGVVEKRMIEFGENDSIVSVY